MKEITSTLFVSFFGGLIAAVISQFFSVYREKISRRAKIFDDLFLEIELTLSKCTSLSSKVWESKGGKSTSDSQEIVCLIQDISTIISFLELKGAKTKLRIEPMFANFRRSISGDDFDVKDRPANPSRTVQIRSNAISLRIALRDLQYEANRLF